MDLWKHKIDQVNKNYVSRKIPGFQKDGDQWDTIKNTLVAFGIAEDLTAKRADAAGIFQFVRPDSGEELAFVSSSIAG